MATAPKANAKVVPMNEAAAAPPAAPAPKSKKKLFIIIGAVVLALAGGGGGAWLFMGQKDEGAAAAAPKPDPGLPPVFFAMDPFTVNLQPELGEQYLQVAFTLQVADPAQVDQIKLYLPLVRSRLLMLLSSKKASDIQTSEGKQKLQQEIIDQVKLPFTPKGQPLAVNGVFFTSFVIQ